DSAPGASRCVMLSLRDLDALNATMDSLCRGLCLTEQSLKGDDGNAQLAAKSEHRQFATAGGLDPWTMTVSIDFTWHKDASGYRLVKRGRLPDRNPPFDTIVPNGGERILIHPMEVSDIYRIFAHVVSAEDLLRFVQRFGLLGRYGVKNVIFGQ